MYNFTDFSIAGLRDQQCSNVVPVYQSYQSSPPQC